MLSHFCDKVGHNSIVHQNRHLDPFGFGDYYRNTIYYGSNVNQMLQDCQKYTEKADKVIIHSQSLILANVNHPDVSMYYHGMDLRGNPKANDKKAKRIFVSTEDLLELRPDAICLPQPIDTELFSAGTLGQGYLMINRERGKETIIENAREFNPDYRIRETCIIPYKDMPNLLRQYHAYVDMKYDYKNPPNLLKAQSMTGLQALSCGLTVYGWDKKAQVGLPNKHRAENVVNHFIKALEDNI